MPSRGFDAWAEWTVRARMGGGVLLRHLAAGTAVAVAVAFAGCARPAAQAPERAAPTASPKPSPAVAAPRHRTATPSPKPARSAAPHVRATPAAAPATPHPKSTIVMASPEAPPKIFSVTMEPPVLRSGDTVTGTVITPSNVASVELRFAGYSTTMTKVSPGHFTFRYQLPNVPFFLTNTYTVSVIARNTRGDQVRRDIPVTIK